MEMAAYKLSDLVSTAGSTIGIIIAGTIILQYLATKSLTLSERYRYLTTEYRGNHASDPRRGSLRKQITSHRRAITYLTWASVSVSIAVLLFLVTVGIAALSMIFPDERGFLFVGTVALFVGLVLIGVGVGLQMAELLLFRRVPSSEVEDFNDLPTLEEAFKH